MMYIPSKQSTHLALHLEQYLAFTIDLLLDGVVDAEQHVLTLHAILRQSPDEMVLPLVSEILPLSVPLLQLFVPGLLSSNHLLFQLLQSGKKQNKTQN